MKEIEFIDPKMPDILHENYVPSPFLIATKGYGNRAELERVKEKTRVQYEKELRLVQQKFERETKEASDDAKHEYFRDLKVPVDAAITRKNYNVRRRASVRGRNHA